MPGVHITTSHHLLHDCFDLNVHTAGGDNRYLGVHTAGFDRYMDPRSYAEPPLIVAGGHGPRPGGRSRRFASHPRRKRLPASDYAQVVPRIVQCPVKVRTLSFKGSEFTYLMIVISVLFLAFVALLFLSLPLL